MAQAARPSAPNPCATASSTAQPLPALLPNATPRTALGKALMPPPDDMAQAARPSAPNPGAAASSAPPPPPARLPNAISRTALAKGAPCPASAGYRSLSGQCRKPPKHFMHKASGVTYVKPDARVKLVPAEDIPYGRHGKPFGRTVGPAKLQIIHSRLTVTPLRSPKASAPLTHKASAPLTHKATTPLTLKATTLGAPCPTSGGDRALSGQCPKALEHGAEPLRCRFQYGQKALMAGPLAPNPCAAASSTALALPARPPNATPRTALAKDTPFPTCGGNRGHSGQFKKPPEHVHVMHKASGVTYVKPDARVKLVPAEDIPYGRHGKPFGRTVGPAKLQIIHSRLTVTPLRSPKASAPLTHKASAPLTHKATTPLTLKATTLGAPCPTSGGDRALSGQCPKALEHGAEPLRCRFQYGQKALMAGPLAPNPCAAASSTALALPARPPNATPRTALAKDTPFPTCGGNRGHSGQFKKPPEHVHVMRKAFGGTYIKHDARVNLIPAEYITYVQHGVPFGRTVGSAKLQKRHCHKASAPLTHKASAPLTHKAMSLGAPFPTCGGKRDFSWQCQKAQDHVYVPLIPRKQLSDELEAAPCTKRHIKHEQEKKRDVSMSCNTSSGFSLDAPGFKAAHCGLNTNGTTTPPESDTDEIGTQIFINFGGSSISSQEKLNKLDVGMLMKSALKRVGVQTNDFYCECSGKYLDKEKLLSDYPIERDSTIKVRTRLRAGNRPTKTWNQIIGMKPRHHVVPLKPPLIGTKHRMENINEARFLHGCIQYYAREVLISLCEKHSRGKSLNGQFTPDDILFKAGKAFFADHIVEVDFTDGTCRSDYLSTHNTFHPVFWDNNLCGLHAEHLLNFLWTCPAGEHSRSEKVIAFLTNHIALLTYSDRMAICSNLDGLILRLLRGVYMNFVKSIRKPNWKPDLNQVPAMKDVLEFASKVNPNTGQLILTYSKDGDQPVHFATNFFKHARLEFTREELEAAFSLAMSRHNYLADLLQSIAMDDTLPPAFDLVELVGHNVLVGMERMEDMDME